MHSEWQPYWRLAGRVSNVSKAASFNGEAPATALTDDSSQFPKTEWTVPIVLGLTLREEFKRERLAGTAIELSNESNTGATQRSAAEFLGITYPTRDILNGIEAVGRSQGQPVVVIGERGRGKSHLMAALFHALHDPASTREWLRFWADTLNDPRIVTVPLRREMLVIEESLQRQRYKFLWDILFARHPHGASFRRQWELLGDEKTDIPSDRLILEMLRKAPTTLLLDEYQTWYDGLTNTKQYPCKTWAFNFTQILSEIATEHSDLLVLVVCLRNGATDAYRQIRRVNPVRIDFEAGASPERLRDRRRMVLHRLFENRLQIPHGRIEAAVAPHVAEYLRLLDVPKSEHEQQRRDFMAAWPFAPHLLQLLEDQILFATQSQETRDLIRILANLFQSRGKSEPILTAADFRLDEESTATDALLAAVANEQLRNLRHRAQLNFASVEHALPSLSNRAPHLQEIMGSLWLRSIAAGDSAGAEPAVLQADITKAAPLDENTFQIEVATIVENSVNIHQTGGRLVFREDENPQAKVMACARNDRLFRDGSDFAHLSKQIRAVVGGPGTAAHPFRVIALPKLWMTDPWSQLEDSEKPNRWDDRATILVLPEAIERIGECLGGWLKEHLEKRRNTVRFLLPRSGAPSMYCDRDLLVLARAELKALEWQHESPAYRTLRRTYHDALRDKLNNRFDRFALLRRWSFADPRRCHFSVEVLGAQGARIPEAIEKAIVHDLFVPEDFEEIVLQAASENSSIRKLLAQLQEPRAGGKDCVPWLGAAAVSDRVLRVCAKGKIAITVPGAERLEAAPGDAEDVAFERLKLRFSSAGHVDEKAVLSPCAVRFAGGTFQPDTVEPRSRREDIFGAGSFGANACGGNENMPRVPPAPEDPVSTPKHRGNLFAASTSGTRAILASAATSQLNLVGKIESWGIGPATPVSDVTIKVAAATGVQLRQLLKKLPDGMIYELSLRRTDGNASDAAPLHPDDDR